MNSITPYRYFLLILVFSSATHAATITVNSDLMDQEDSDGFCTLVEAVIAANDNLASGATPGECAAGDVGLDDIIFDLPAGVSVIETQGIQLYVLEALSVTGPGADLLTLDAQHQGNFFLTRAAISLSGLTFANAVAYAGTVVYQADPADLTLSDCVIHNNIGEDSSGGAVRVLGDDTPTMLRINNCVFSDNYSPGYGGAIYIGVGSGKHIDAQINDSVFINNTSEDDEGGAISAYLHDEGSGVLNIHNSRFEQNSSGVNGGALYLRGIELSGKISQSTFYNNHANYGGGAVMWFQTGEFYSINNTFHNNTSNRYAAAIYTWANFPSRNADDLNKGDEQFGIHLINNTITNNNILTDTSIQGGGGIYSRNNYTSLSNTVIANNTTMTEGPDCSGSFTSNDFNFISDKTGCSITAASGDMFGNDVAPLDPMLGAAVDDLNLHVYQEPAMGSPLIDAGNPLGCADGFGNQLTRDQLGAFRHQDGGLSGENRCDIGAVEVVNSDVIFKNIFE